MKEFKKNQEGHFICEECRKNYVKKDGLSKHINLLHNGVKAYYDKWLKDKNEGKCKICNNQISLIAISGMNPPPRNFLSESDSTKNSSSLAFFFLFLISFYLTIVI